MDFYLPKETRDFFLSEGFISELAGNEGLYFNRSQNKIINK